MSFSESCFGFFEGYSRLYQEGQPTFERMCFPFKYSTWSARDAHSFSVPMVLWVLSRLCFSSERAISMCAYRAGTLNQKGHACRRQDFFWGEGGDPTQFNEEAR